MSVELRLQEITFSGGAEALAVGDADVIVFIGPNNAGKSRALRELETALINGHQGEVVTGTVAERAGTAEELRAWLELVAPQTPGPPGQPEHRTTPDGGALHVASAERNWTNADQLGDLAKLMVFRADAETRLHLAGSVESVDALNGQATKPLQRLLTDHAAEAALSLSTQRAFGEAVHVNRAGGAILHLHLGQPDAEPRLDNPAYIAQLRELPLVAEQGDGMRSFIGLMLALTTPFPLVLIDEPEAFLHPPQARELGRQLAKATGRQRVVATHSSDVLIGLLDATTSMVIVRLRRDGSSNVPSVLSRAQIDSIWSDPSLRYSNLLDGLFHPGVIVGESDGDARLYAAALDAELEAEACPASDLLFTHCGGKHNLAAAINALRPMGVPVAAIADLDVLRDRTLLAAIVEALGGAWAAFEPDWRTLSAAVAQRPVPALRVETVREEIMHSLGTDASAALTEAQVRRIREITKSSDGWKHAREGGGVSGFPRGDATAAAQHLIDHLARIGLFVVPVGALEGWAPEIGGHGGKFVASALSSNVHSTNTDLRAFVARAAGFVG